MKQILKTLLIIAAAFALCITTNAQKVEVEAKTVEICARCLTESPLKDKVIETQTAEITALKNEMRATENLVAAKNQIIDLQMKQIEIFRAIKCDSKSFLFGVIKVKRCL